MKLKPIVASVALALSGAAIAGHSTVAHKRPRKWGALPPHRAVAVPRPHHIAHRRPGYWAKHAMPPKVGARHVPAPAMAKLQMLLDKNQTPYYPTRGWFSRIAVSGLLQANAFMGNRNAAAAATSSNVNRFPEAKRTSTDLWLSRANLYVDANVNPWLTGHIALRYGSFAGAGSHAGLVDPANFRRYGPLDEAYMTIGKFARSNIYGRIGREYIPYGDYKRDSVIATFTQLLTQTQVEAAQVGFVNMRGFSGAAYIFRGAGETTGSSSRHFNNGGLQLGYTWTSGLYALDLSADYLANMNSVNYLAAAVGTGGVGMTTTVESVGGMNLTAKGRYGRHIDGMVQYTSAVKRFDSTGSEPGWKTTTGARPSAFLADFGYSFVTVGGYPSRLGFSYQKSFQALGFAIPRNRIQADYTLRVLKHTELGAHVIFDKDYATGDTAANAAGTTLTGTGRSSTAGFLSLTTRFA